MLKLPRSALYRHSVSHIILLDRVVEWERLLGLGFEGKHLRPGTRIDESAFPDPVVLLECAGKADPGRGKRCFYIIWQLDRRTLQWRELARATAEDASWAIALRPIAANALRAGRPANPDANAIADRVVLALDNELRGIEPKQRGAVLSALYPQIAGRIVQWCETSLGRAPEVSAAKA